MKDQKNFLYNYLISPRELLILIKHIFVQMMSCIELEK